MGDIIEFPAPKPAPRLLTPAECAAAEPRGYLLKGILAPGDFAIVFGQPGAGKSVIGPYLAYAVAQGRSIFGRRVRQGRALYIPSEDPAGMKQRVAALMQEHGDAADFRLMEGASGLLSSDAGRRSLDAAIDDFQPAVVVVDTLAAAFPGLDENDGSQMGRAVEILRDIAAQGCAVVLIHHTPKADDSTPRGHGSLNGAADVTIRLARDETTVTGTLGKNRNGASAGVVLAFTIKSHALGEDDDGDDITAPILVETDGPAGGKGTRPSKIEAAALGFLHDLLVDEGRPLPPSGGFPPYPELRGVELDRWREECGRRGLSTSESPEVRRRAFTRAVEGLRDKRLVAMLDGIVWAANRPVSQ